MGASRLWRRSAVVLAGLIFAMCLTAATASAEEFALESFTTSVVDELGNEISDAGTHPFAASAEIKFEDFPRPGYPEADLRGPAEEPRDIVVQLPPGFVGNPQAAERCELHFIKTNPLPTDRSPCPLTAAVGHMVIDGLVNLSQPIFNVVPEDGYPAEFAFSHQSFTFVLYPELRSDGDFGINIASINSPSDMITGIRAELCSWGLVETSVDPSFPTYACRERSDAPPGTRPFLTMPSTECPAEQPVTKLRVNSWQNPTRFIESTFASPLITACETMTFEPAVDIQPTTTLPAAPSGLEVDMTFPQDDNAHGQAPPALKKAVVTLPDGVSVNPSAADGLVACSDGDLRLRSKLPVRCPEASKIGEVEAVSPLLDEPVRGGVFIRSQNSSDPASGEMFRLALVLENKKRGISIRLPGQVRVDPNTGRIETTFDNNPELPVESIRLKLKDGPRAPLSMPSECGEHLIETTLTSWGKQTVNLESSFQIDCSARHGGFDPVFSAGTFSPIAGGSSPFSLQVLRSDGEQEFEQIRDIKLPEGLLADISSVEICPAAAADAGVCGESSRVGRLEVAAGSGASPLWVPQAGKSPTRVHLSGPYRGAPYSLSIVVPAQAGPFDLGSVVVRSALHVDERTAQVSSGVDQSRLINPDGTVSQILEGDIPRIMKGVLLNQREIRVIVDRPGFMINPTNCSQQSVSAQLLGYGGGQASVSNRFRAVECANLGFKPRFNARILDKGRRSTVRSWHPRTRFTVVPRKGDANIGGARVALPSSTILDQSNIGTTCTRAQMAERACPAKSLVGYAKAWSPLLRKAVEGPVYLAANGGVRPLPDLAAVLDGEIRVVLQGEVSTLRSGGKARLQNTFRVVPDAPVSRFVLTMRGGKNRGLLVNSTDLCRTNERGVAVFAGQNGKRHRLGLRLTPSFKGCAKVRRQAARRKAAR